MRGIDQFGRTKMKNLLVLRQRNNNAGADEVPDLDRACLLQSKIHATFNPSVIIELVQSRLSGCRQTRRNIIVFI